MLGYFPQITCKKGNFPHLLNRKGNYNTILQKLPFGITYIFLQPNDTTSVVNSKLKKTCNLVTIV